MTLKEAEKIIEIHDYHTAQRYNARMAGDEELVKLHQACLTNMRELYDEASNVIAKHNSK